MLDLLRDLLSGWATVMGAEGVGGIVGPWLAPVLAVTGVVIAFAGVKVFRPTFTVVVFFGATALLMFALSPLLPWYAVVSIVAVVGVFAAFLAAFMRRVAITCLTALGMTALVFTMTNGIALAVIGGVVALVVSLFRPKEAYIAVAAMFGAFLCAPSALSLAASAAPHVAEVLNGELTLFASSFALAVAGGGVQAFLSRKGLDPVFTQVIDLSQSHRMHGGAESQPGEESMRIGQEPSADSVLTRGTAGVAPSTPAVAPVGISSLAAGAVGAAVRTSVKQPVEVEESVSLDQGLSCPERRASETEHSNTIASESANGVPEHEEHRADTCVKEVVPADSTSTDAEATWHSSHSGLLHIDRPRPYEPSYRKEIKYRIIEQDFLRLRNMMDAYLAYDSYSGAKGYAVRSLYFDSLDDRDLYDKLDGTLEHKKIRMRAYDPMGDSFNLEFKCRWNQDGFKRKLKLSREQAKRLVANDYSVLLQFDDPLARELFDRMVRGRYSAKVIVEYQRTAWVYPVSNIRVTWDQGIRASYFPEAFFEERPLYIPIVPESQGVLEIKYDYVFPSVLKDALHALDQLPVANSKYALGRTYL